MLHCIIKQMLGIVHQSLCAADIDKSARYDIRSGKYLSGTALQCEHDDNDTVLCQMLAVTQHDIADVADAESLSKKSRHTDKRTAAVTEKRDDAMDP